MVMITGGANDHHTAEIMAVTAKMYQVRLDDNRISMVKHKNVRELYLNSRHSSRPEQVRSNPKEEDTINIEQDTNNIEQVSETSSITTPPSRSRATTFSTTQRAAVRHWTQEQCEHCISEALEEIHRQATIVAEFTERLRLMNLGDDDYTRI